METATGREGPRPGAGLTAGIAARERGCHGVGGEPGPSEGSPTWGRAGQLAT